MRAKVLEMSLNCDLTCSTFCLAPQHKGYGSAYCANQGAVGLELAWGIEGGFSGSTRGRGEIRAWLVRNRSWIMGEMYVLHRVDVYLEKRGAEGGDWSLNEEEVRRRFSPLAPRQIRTSSSFKTCRTSNKASDTL